MGLFNKLRGEGPEYPTLDTSSAAAARLQKFSNEIEQLAKQVNDPLEVIPTEDSSYVFIGKPPKKFGIAWISDGKIHNFRTLVRDHGVSEMKLQLISEKLRKAYENASAERYSTTIADRKIVITQSDMLESEVQQIIQQAAG